jgi:glycosyltransferase involved in cell wall biosynthesis
VNSLSIVIPAFNEAASIASVVAEAMREGAAAAPVLEVVVCDDGSRDATGAVLAEIADPRVRVLTRRVNRGIEASIRSLYWAARHEWIFLISADRQWPMTSLHVLATHAAQTGADLVVGVRHAKREVYTPYRQVLSRGFEWIVKAMGSPVGDPGSIKLGRAEALRVPVSARGVFAEGERLIRAARAGWVVEGCPVAFERRRSGKATGAAPKVVMRALADTVRTGLSLATGWPPASPPGPIDVDEAPTGSHKQ